MKGSAVRTTKRVLLVFDRNGPLTIRPDDFRLLVLPVAVATPYLVALEFQRSALRRGAALRSFDRHLVIRGASLTLRYLHLLVESHPTGHASYPINQCPVVAARSAGPESATPVIFAVVNRIG